MSILKSLADLLIGGGMAVGGKIASDAEKKKKLEAWEAEERRKEAEKRTAVDRQLAEREEEKRRIKASVESLVGGSLDEDWQRPRPYNVLREYDLAMEKLRAMLECYKRIHPRGSELVYTVRHVDNCGGVFDNHAFKQSMFLPIDPDQYERVIVNQFLRNESATFRGPLRFASTGEIREVTYGVSSGLYALGEARKQLIREGFCPSNCCGKLWEYWNPYIYWDGIDGAMNDQFKSAMELRIYIPGAEYTQVLYNNKKSLELYDWRILVEKMQDFYKQQHPEYAVYKGGTDEQNPQSQNQ